MSDITTIPMRHRIVVAQTPDGWVCVLCGCGIGPDPGTWEQARNNARKIWHADPSTCRIVDARIAKWEQAERDSRRMLEIMERRGDR